MDIYTPEEFRDAVISAFSAIEMACLTTIVCDFRELVAVLDWATWLTSGQGQEAWPNVIGNFKARDDTVHSARFQARARARDDRPHDVFLQTRRYSSSRVREVVTRDMRSSITFGTDRQLPFPVIVDYTCPWEPNDSAVGPGILYLAKEVVGEPQYVEFGPVYHDQEGNPIEKPWAAELKAVWGELQEHYSDQAFTVDRQVSLENFFRSLPWGGLKDLLPCLRPPFQLPLFGDDHEQDGPNDSVQQVLDSVGLDTQGHLRVGFTGGRDTMEYPLAMARPTFGKTGTFLDGEKRTARQRKRKGGCQSSLRHLMHATRISGSALTRASSHCLQGSFEDSLLPWRQDHFRVHHTSCRGSRMWRRLQHRARGGGWAKSPP